MKNTHVALDNLNRRQAVKGVAVVLGSLVAGLRGLGQSAAPALPSSENEKRTSIHQEPQFDAAPGRVFSLLMDSKLFSDFTGRPAEIDAKEGGAYSLFGGLIVGRNVELIPDQRIVQAWRPTHWDSGVYSIVKFQLVPKGSGTIVVFDHTGFPEGEYDHLLAGWNGHYWAPIAKALSR